MLFTYIVYADSLDDFLFRVNKNILNPLIELGFVIAFVLFLYGFLQFLRNARSPEKRDKSKQHMLWGVIGFFIMFSVFGIINLLLSTFGITGAKINKDQQTFDPPPVQELQFPK